MGRSSSRRHDTEEGKLAALFLPCTRAVLHQRQRPPNPSRKREGRRQQLARAFAEVLLRQSFLQAVLGGRGDCAKRG